MWEVSEIYPVCKSSAHLSSQPYFLFLSLGIFSFQHSLLRPALQSPLVTSRTAPVPFTQPSLLTTLPCRYHDISGSLLRGPASLIRQPYLTHGQLWLGESTDIALDEQGLGEKDSAYGTFGSPDSRDRRLGRSATQVRGVGASSNVNMHGYGGRGTNATLYNSSPTKLLGWVQVNLSQGCMCARCMHEH